MSNEKMNAAGNKRGFTVFPIIFGCTVLAGWLSAYNHCDTAGVAFSVLSGVSGGFFGWTLKEYTTMPG